MPYSDENITDWTHLVTSTEDIAVSNEDISVVEEAAANLSSSAAFHFNMPTEIADLIVSAIKTGYGQALRDIRDRKVDGLGPLEVDGLY